MSINPQSNSYFMIDLLFIPQKVKSKSSESVFKCDV